MLVEQLPTDGDLEALLAESVAHATSRERAAFDEIADAASGIVLVGAGGLGRRVLRGLAKVGITPLAMADNNSQAHGTRIDGVEVMAPAEAAQRFGAEAVFVVTIWGANSPHRFAHTRAQLQALGVQRISTFAPLLWKYPEQMLPHYCQELPHRAVEQGRDIREANALWADENSRREYHAQLRFRILGDFDGLPHPVEHPQYFPDDLFVYGPAEVFVDCGAYDGDTIKVLMARHGAAVSRIIALEPDPVNVVTLANYTASIAVPSGVVVLPLAAAATHGRTFIETTGTASSAITGADAAGATAIDCATLDEVLAGEMPTFIKMDIEGAEPDALSGAGMTIRRTRPVLAICVYHRQDHLWRLPLMMNEMCTDYRFFLRPHNEEGWDLVCYGVPVERLRSGADAQ